MTDRVLPLVLVVDDEPQIQRFLKPALTAAGYAVEQAVTGAQALQRVRTTSPTLLILDLGLPDMDGVAVLKRLREWSDVPVLILSVRDQEPVKIAAFDAGADDYVTKPFSTAELVARLTAIQRRRYTQQSPVHELGALKVDVVHHEASARGESLKLTPTEFALLKVLVQNAGRIVTQKQIIREVWGTENTSQSDSLRVFINHLRTKLGDTGPKIVNEPGIGYRMVADESGV
jgi:two-component system KDP operon response regulator KdpE